MNYSLNLAFVPGILLTMMIAAVLLIISVIVRSMKKKKPLENPIYFYVARYMHYMTCLFIGVYYLFIFSPASDWIFIVGFLAIIFHWQFLKDECVLSYLEKKGITDSYEPGMEVYNHPFMDDLFGSFSRPFMNINFFATVFTFIYVFVRATATMHIAIRLLIIPMAIGLLIRHYISTKQRGWGGNEMELFAQF
jgi:hypothetical protein